MNGVIIMTEKNLETLKVMSLLKEKKLTQAGAGKRLNISDRQIRNIFKKYSEFGDQGVISKKLGKASNHQLSNDLKDKALHLIKTKYSDFGPTLASEKLQDLDQIKISVGTIRNIMIENGLWHPKEIRKKIHRLRARRAYFGELIQIDGSHHHWFEDRGGPCVLIVMIDDATSELMGLLFVPEEDLNAYFKLSKKYFLREGLPLSMYSDRFSVFAVVRKNPLLEETAVTQFKRALAELNIQLICAKTPQAKGRVERVNRTLQDRLVKELRLHNICTIEEANHFLQESDYIKKHNAIFGVPPAQKDNVHRSLSEKQLLNLDRILSRNNERVIQKDLSFQYGGEIYQIITSEPHRILAKSKIIIWEDSDKTIRAEINGKEIGIKSMKEIQYEPSPPKIGDLPKTWKTKNKYIPNQNHPYKISYKQKHNFKK